MTSTCCTAATCVWPAGRGDALGARVLRGREAVHAGDDAERHDGGQGEGGDLGEGLGHGGLLGSGVGFGRRFVFRCVNYRSSPAPPNRLATTGARMRRELPFGATNRPPPAGRAGNAGCPNRERPRGVAARDERLPMDIKQDPNSIPNFNSGGRIGELQRGRAGADPVQRRARPDGRRRRRRQRGGAARVAAGRRTAATPTARRRRRMPRRRARAPSTAWSARPDA